MALPVTSVRRGVAGAMEEAAYFGTFMSAVRALALRDAGCPLPSTLVAGTINARWWRRHYILCMAAAWRQRRRHISTTNARAFAAYFACIGQAGDRGGVTRRRRGGVSLSARGWRRIFAAAIPAVEGRRAEGRGA